MLQEYKDQKDVDENNKFKVYYFPKKGLPYDMGYTQNGRFIEKFEDGFFDEAGKSELILLAMGSLPTARCTTRPAPAPENLHLTLKEELDA